MLRASTYLCLFLSVFWTQVLAQDCNAILQHGLRNISVSQSDDARIATTYYNNCGTNFSSMSDDQLVKAEVSIFGFGGGSGRYNHQQRADRLQQWCTAKQGFAESHQREYQMAQDIYAPAVTAWSTCNNLVSRQVQIRPSITPDDQTVDIQVSYSGPGTNVRLQDVPTEGFSCTIHGSRGAGSSLPITLGPDLVNVHCLRAKPTQQTVNGSQLSKFERGTISVLTYGETLQLFFPEKWDPLLPQAASQRLSDQIQTLNTLAKP